VAVLGDEVDVLRWMMTLCQVVDIRTSNTLEVVAVRGNRETEAVGRLGYVVVVDREGQCRRGHISSKPQASRTPCTSSPTAGHWLQRSDDGPKFGHGVKT